jgi:peptidoglycan/LPS O-acetylase OafA/YrhL
MHRLQGPDALRGIACSGVVLHHMAYFTPDASGIIYQFARMFLGLGVPLFFMISAFAMKEAYEGKLDSTHAVIFYALRRIMRILPLYIVMLLFYIYQHNPILSDWHLEKKIAHYLLYATLMFGLVPSIAHGLVWASWSISVEALFYIAFPMFSNRAVKLAYLFGLVIMGHAFNYYLAPKISPSAVNTSWYWAVAWHLYIPFFILGIIAHQLYKLTLIKNKKISITIIGLSFLFSLALTTVLFLWFEWPFTEDGNIIPQNFINLLICSTPVLFFLMLLITISSPGILVNAATIFIGKISYSIYLIHPILVFSLIPYFKIIQKDYGVSTLSFGMSSCLVFVILIPISYLSFKLIESPFIRWGKFLTKPRH